MVDKLLVFFYENDFDIHEPRSGHFDRFRQKLKLLLF